MHLSQTIQPVEMPLLSSSRSNLAKLPSMASMDRYVVLLRGTGQTGLCLGEVRRTDWCHGRKIGQLAAWLPVNKNRTTCFGYLLDIIHCWVVFVSRVSCPSNCQGVSGRVYSYSGNLLDLNPETPWQFYWPPYELRLNNWWLMWHNNDGDKTTTQLSSTEDL
jgi:hypothetical protein